MAVRGRRTRRGSALRVPRCVGEEDLAAHAAYGRRVTDADHGAAVGVREGAFVGVWCAGGSRGAGIGAAGGGGREVREKVGVRGEFGEGWAGEGEGWLVGGGRHGW